MNAFKRLLTAVSGGVGSHGDGFFAVVVSTSPLMVRIETDPDQVAQRAINLVGGLVAGDRVFVSVFGRRLVVLGRPGGDRVSWGEVAGKPTTFPPTPEHDTGWVALTMASGWDAAAGDPPMIRCVGNEVFARGFATRSSGNIPNSYTEVFKVPASIPMPAPPKTSVRIMAMGAGGCPVGWDIQLGRSARVMVNGSHGAASTWLSLDDLYWRTD